MSTTTTAKRSKPEDREEAGNDDVVTKYLALFVFTEDDYNNVYEEGDGEILDDENIEKYAVKAADEEAMDAIEQNLIMLFQNAEDEIDQPRKELGCEIRDTVTINASKDRKKFFISFNLTKHNLKEKEKALRMEVTDGFFSAPCDVGSNCLGFWTVDEHPLVSSGDYDRLTEPGAFGNVENGNEENDDDNDTVGSSEDNSAGDGEGDDGDDGNDDDDDEGEDDDEN